MLHKTLIMDTSTPVTHTHPHPFLPLLPCPYPHSFLTLAHTHTHTYPHTHIPTPPPPPTQARQELLKDTLKEAQEAHMEKLAKKKQEAKQAELVGIRGAGC